MFNKTFNHMVDVLCSLLLCFLSRDSVHCILCGITILGCWIGWFIGFSTRHGSIGVGAALIFLIVETLWTCIFINGVFSPSLPNCKTTWVQFWINVLWCPIFIGFYRDLITYSFLRVIMFPLNIWMLEIIQGYWLIWMFGRNIAWTYKDLDDAMFHGNIRLNYLFPWLLLGLGVEVGWDPVLEIAVQMLIVNNMYLYVLILSIPVSYVSDKILGYPAMMLKE